jgi:hypothetical protein
MKQPQSSPQGEHSAARLETPPPESVPADRRRPHPMPIARRLLMLLIVLGVLGAFALLIWLAVQIRAVTEDSHIATADDVHRAARLLRILAWILSASIVAAATWIGHFAWRIRRNEVYPPPGSRHLHVRRILRGEEARRVANVCMAFAVVLLLCGFGLAPLVTHVLESIGFR